MLRSIGIQSVALIDQLNISFENGFSVLTGETGAGKSIIIEAFNFVLGERAARELIKNGRQKAIVEAVFDVLPEDMVQKTLSQLDLSVEEDGSLTLYRELSVSGKGVCRVNGTPVSAAILKQVGDALVDIHGQHAHQSLLNPKLHVDMLDAFAGETVGSLKRATADAYRTAAAAGKKLRGAEMDERERARRCDLLAYQIQEIDAANLSDGEEEALLEQRAVLQNAQQVMESLEESAEMLSGDERALSLLSGALRAMERIAPLHKDYADAADRLREAYYTLEDASYAVRDLKADFTYEPGALDEIEQRLETLSLLRRKYGDTVAEVIAYRARIGEEYEALITSEERRAALQDAYDAALAQYEQASTALSALRKETAARLTERLLPELCDLGMPGAAFEVFFSRLEGDAPSSNGFDSVEFLLSANRGEPVKPLSRVASGGETSRIMLAFKSVLAASDGIPTMVFDEIDTGISGKIGTGVAVKMRQIAKKHQVLCITHLPQIAAFANVQYLVFKETAGEETHSSAVRLTYEQRVQEIARIMGSSPDDAIAMQHAARLIEAAETASVAMR